MTTETPFERVRSSATRQALPLLLACLVLAGAGLVVASIALPEGINWLAALLGGATLLAGVALIGHAALLRPDSLRSEARTEILRPIGGAGQDNAARPAEAADHEAHRNWAGRPGTTP